MSAFADLALAYHAGGANVVPIVPGTKVPPAGVDWGTWKHRRQTPDDVARFVAVHPGADIALVLRDGLVDLETDGAHGEQALRNLRLPIPLTASWESPRGLHRLYRSPHPVRSCIGLHPGLDLLADGRYVVVPPSTGRRWLTPGGLAEVAEFPDAWIEMVTPRGNASPHLSISPDPSAASIERSLDTGLLLDTCLPGTRIQDLFGDVRVVMAVAARLGISSPELRRPFRCILPGHSERHPSATLCRNAKGTVVYHDWHRRGGLEYLTLPEVRAALAYGEARRLRAPELTTWGLRLLVEAQILRPAPVNLPPLPSTSSSAICRVRDGFHLLLGCKWLYEPGAPAPFSWRFASVWCGVGERYAGVAIHKLLYLGVIRQVSTYKRMALFLPGSGTS